MNFISQMPFPRSISNHFIVGSTSLLFILPEYLSNFGGISCHHLKIKEEFFLHILSALSEIHGSSLISSSHKLFSVVGILFIYPKQFKILFSLILRSPSSQSNSYQISALVPQSYRCIIQILSNQLVITSFSCI